MSKHSIVSGEAYLFWAQLNFSLSPVKWGRGVTYTAASGEA